MAYQKTAKDLAWDRERAKLRHEAEEWRMKYNQSQAIISAQEQEMLAYESENQSLREAITYLTEGAATPDEVLEKMKKQSELCDMMKFLVNGTRGDVLMWETIIIPIIVASILLGSFLFAKHMDAIRMQAWLDKKIIIEKWIKYRRIKDQYETGHDFIVSVEEVNEAEQDLRKVAKWYNDKYRLYGYCCPPELLFDLED